MPFTYIHLANAVIQSNLDVFPVQEECDMVVATIYYTIHADRSRSITMYFQLKMQCAVKKKYIHNNHSTAKILRSTVIHNVFCFVFLFFMVTSFILGFC